MTDEEKYEREYIANTLRAIQNRRFDAAANLIIKAIIGDKIHSLQRQGKSERD